MSAEFDLSIGVSKIGKIKYSNSNKEIFNLAITAFNKYSKYKNNVININYFLQSIQIVSNLEAGFDGINTYDNAGISIGFLQFADPNSNAYSLLNIFNPTLANEMKSAFGTRNPYKDSKSLKARQNKLLISSIQQALITPQGIDAQFKMAIQNYWDVAFTTFLSLNFQVEADMNPMNISTTTAQVKDQNPYKVYGAAFIFDLGVNQGIGKISGSKNVIKQLTNMTEGNFLNYHINNIYLRPERKEFWNNILNSKFKIGSTAN